jgi:hypothetical protein
LWLPLVNLLINTVNILRPKFCVRCRIFKWSGRNSRRELAPCSGYQASKHLGHGGGGEGAPGEAWRRGVADTEHLVCACPCQNAVKNGQMHELYSVSFYRPFYIYFFDSVLSTQNKEEFFLGLIKIFFNSLLRFMTRISVMKSRHKKT